MIGKVGAAMLISAVLALSPCMAQEQQSSKKAETGPSPEELELQSQLVKVKRIYVESFGDDPVSKAIHAMVINSLHASKRFIITENKEKADAILKGSAVKKTFQELHGLSEGAAAGVAAGGHSGSVSGSWSGGSGHISGSSGGGFVAQSVAAEDSTISTETIDHAEIAVRLVTQDGDVIWASTQESKGAKYKGAAADVADKITKQLLRDLDRAKSEMAPPK